LRKPYPSLCTQNTHLRVAYTASQGNGAALGKYVLSFPIASLQRSTCGTPKSLFSLTGPAGDDAMEMAKDGFTIMFTTFTAQQRALLAQSLGRGRRRQQ
jgi:hypothetical protein